MWFFQYNIDDPVYFKNVSNFPIDFVNIVTFDFAMVQAIKGHEVSIFYIDDCSVKVVSLPQGSQKLIVSGVLLRESPML